MFFGCSIALAVAIVVETRVANLIEHKDSGQYMDTLKYSYKLFLI